MTPAARAILHRMIDAPASAADVIPSDVPAVLGIVAELQAALTLRLMAGANGHAETVKAPAEAERLLTVEQAADLFAVAPRWLYRHAAQIPGARRLSRKCLRFSESGLRRYLAARRA